MIDAVETEVVEEADLIQEALDDFNSDIDTPVNKDDFDTPIEADTTETVEETDNTAENSEESTEESKETSEEMYTLKHFDGDKQVNLKEMQDLAQMGMDRERILTQRDEARNDPRLAISDRISKLSELYAYTDVTALVDALFNSYDEQQADSQGVSAETIKRERAALEREERYNAERIEKQSKEDNTKPYTDFVNQFPNVKADEIPSEVWVEVNKGVPIVKAYADFIGKSKESEATKEIEALKSELAILKKNSENKTKTKTASIEGKTDAITQDSYLDIWDK